jgi:hypothetical protein
VPSRPVSFWSQVDIQANGHWLWMGAMAGDYGVYYHNGVRIGAHVYAYEAYYNVRVPKGFDIHHECEIKRCVCPLHTRQISHSKHTGLVHKMQERCLRGHIWDEQNTIWFTKANGSPYRQCRACGNIRQIISRRIKRGTRKAYARN